MIASELIARVTVLGADKAIRDLAGVGAASDSVGSKLGKGLLIGSLIGVAALVGIGIAAGKMAGDFQQGVNRLKTGGGDVQDSFQSLWNGIQKVAVATGTLTGPLTAADYLIVSAGQRGAQSFATLTAAAQGAQIEMANVKDVTQILTTIQTNFGISAHTAAQYMDGLVSAVSHGKITLEDLSTAMSPILPMAHELGIHFSDIAAAMSDMTNQGVPANRGAQALRFVMQSIIAPTVGAQKAMKEFGVNSEQVAQTMKTSFPDALQIYITAAEKGGGTTKDFVDRLGAMVGGGTRAGQALWALAQSMGVWRADIKDVNAALGDTNKNVEGWATVQGNLNLQIDRGRAALEVMLQNIGEKLLPVVTALIPQFIAWTASMGELIGKTDFSGLISGIKQAAKTAGDLFNALGTVANALRPLQPLIVPVATELLVLWGAFKLLSIGGAVTSAITSMAMFGTGATAVGTSIAPLPVAISTLATSIAGIGVAATAAIGGLVLLDAALLTNMYTTQQADNAKKGSMQVGSTALQNYINQDIAGLEKLNAQYHYSASDWQAWSVSIAADLQQVAGVSSDVAQAIARNIINAAKNNEHVIGQTALMTSMYQKWLDVLKSGVLISWGDFQAQQNAITQAAIRKTAASTQDLQAKLLNLNKPETISINTAGIANAKQHTDELQAKLLNLNKPEKPPVDTSSIINAGNTADNTRRKLQALNGPYEPIVNVSSVLSAGYIADNTRRKLQALNGSSTWTAYANLNQINTVTNIVSTIQSGPGNARAAGGMIDEPVVGVGLRTGQRWTFGENGPEMVTPMKGGGASGGSGTGGGSGSSGAPVHVHIHVAGREVAVAVLPDIVSAIRNATGARI
jgi:TP901 family phage tail tape measure protein